MNNSDWPLKQCEQQQLMIHTKIDDTTIMGCDMSGDRTRACTEGNKLTHMQMYLAKVIKQLEID